MPQTQTDGIDKPPKKAAIVCFGIGLLLAAGLSACGSESSSEQGSLGAVVGIVEENTGIENSSYAQCLLDGLSDAGLDETGALEAIENLYSADAGQSSVAEPAELTLIGCLNEIPSDLRAALIPPDAELMTEASSYGELDELLDACEGGSDDACFELYWAAPNGSEYEEIAYSCAGRCELEVYAGAEFGSNPYWDGLVGTCEEGFDSSCAELYWYSDVASEYEAFGDVCGGRCEDAPFSVATGYGDQPYLDRLWDFCADGDDRSCGLLFWFSEDGGEYGSFADVCGGRCEGGPFSTAMSYGDNPFLDELWEQCESGQSGSCVDLTWFAEGSTDYYEFGWQSP